MTPFDALAAAIRERLTSGRPAPLPGLGTLVRQHVSARVEERADGTRVLLPPGETIGLTPTDDTHETLAPTFGRLLALPDGEVQRAYAEAADQLEARLAATGEVRLPGVGLLRRTSGGVILGVEAELLAAVNRMYEGLSPVGPSRSDDRAAAASPTGAPPAADALTENDPGESYDDGSYDDEPFADGPTDDEAAGADPFMIGLPPVDSPEPLQDDRAAPDADATPPPATDEPYPADPDPWAPAATEPVHDDPLDLPVTADASEFGLAPPPVDAFDFVDAPPSPTGDDSDDGAPYPTGPSLPNPSAPEDDAGGAVPYSAPVPDVADDALPEPFDPGDLSSEPLLASDLVPATVEPPEPDEPFAHGPEDAPEDAPSPPAAASVHDGTFVDDDTLDADLDDVLAVPFGRPDDEPIAEVLPPSAPDSEGEAMADAETGSPDDAWVADTWTSGASPPPPVGLGDRDTVEIEDAEVIEDGPRVAGWTDDDLIAEADVEEAPGPVEDAAEAPPPGPDDEFEALLASPPVGTPAEPPPAIEADAPTPVATVEPTPRRRPWGWVLALLLLAAVVAAAVWLWPRFSDREVVPPTRTEVREPLAAPAPDVEPTPTPDDDRSDSLASPSSVRPGAVTPGAVTPGAAAPAGRNVTPEPDAPSSATPSPRSGGTAFAPPRLDGLDDGDRRTLVGPPIDPSMGGWTLVVASLRSEDAAADLMGRYRAAGYRTAVFPPSGRTVTRYRIGVGQFGSRDQARRLLDRVYEYEPGGTWPLNLRTL